MRKQTFYFCTDATWKSFIVTMATVGPFALLKQLRTVGLPTVLSKNFRINYPKLGGGMLAVLLLILFVSDYTDKCYTRDQLANHFSQIPALNIHNSPYR